MTPVVPLRGSISASGDLTPLAYIAGALEGNPDILIQRPTANGYEKIPSNKALSEAGLTSLTFGPKEGLGLLNGTAFSSGSASLVMFEANQLVLLSQALTAMGTEAMMGNRRNYHPFISEVRPHNGQREAAANIFAHLEGSKLAIDEGPGGEAKLAQDRYAWRTAPQWIGPQLENMKLAAEQLQTELNSTTDNPLVDPSSEEIYHGGNFQAVSVTSAMEKTMSAMQMLGKMFFAQCSELINPMLSNGLPPNLCFDDPNISFAFKGIDINMAAYMSELAYLAHPVSNYVQSAEMHNQGLNSLAFIASRYAGDTVELLSLMTATYLYVICQALDLRALHLEFINTARPQIDIITMELISTETQDVSPEAVQKGVWDVLMGQWAQNSSKNLPERSSTTAASSLGQVLQLVGANSLKVNPQQWMKQVDDILVGSYAATVKQFLIGTTTKQYLGASSTILYEFVRETLGVPMHRGVIDHPTYESGEPASEKKTIGTNIAQVYAALRGGKFMDVLLRCHAVAGN
jgi:phenylalanine ammonia-lyase